MGRPKGFSLTDAMDRKVLGYMSTLLDERIATTLALAAAEEEPLVLSIPTSENNNSANENNNIDNSISSGTTAQQILAKIAMPGYKDITTSEAVKYILSKDSQLARTKREIVRKTIERVLTKLKDDEAEAAVLAEQVDLGNRNEDQMIGENGETSMANGETSNETGNGKKRSKGSLGTTTANKKSKIDRTPPDTKLSSLGGMEEVITQLMEVVGMPILHPEIYLATGVEAPRGVLLHGPPGCGKTTLANALANELQVPFISISAPSVVSGMSGESEKKVRELFAEAKLLAPCLIFMDEIDAITPKRDGAQREMEKRIVAQMLTCIDDLGTGDRSKPVIILGATNRPDSLDPALRRAGRFDREICLNVPNEENRMRILMLMTKSLKIGGEIDFKKLAKMTPGFVGADLKALASAAGIAAIKRIFTTLTLPQQEATNNGSMITDDAMDIDDDEISKEISNKKTLQLNETSPEPSRSLIETFLKLYPDRLTPEQLEPLSISFQDFLTALPTIQPTAKREGFATIPDVTWNKVGALSSIRVELHMAIVQPIKRPDLYSKFGVTVPGGVLLWGPPGCGKTLLAKAVANESKANFISIKGPELLNKYVGESERAVRQVFARARASVPCIIFFDELDALVPRRDSSLLELSARVVNTLLTELDGLNDRNGIYVIGATNRPDMIDPAMRRPGRLDKTLYVELPSVEEKYDILKTLIKVNNTPLGLDVDLKIIANDPRAVYFSGADLSALVREAGVLALKKKFYRNGVDDNDMVVLQDDNDEDGSNLVSKDDFEDALNKIKASVSKLELEKYEMIHKEMIG